MFCLGCRVSVLQPPYVLLLSPRLSAGPAAGASALSRSVAQGLLFCASPRLCCLYGKECWLRRPAPPPLLRGQLRPLPLSRGLVLLLRVWQYLPLVLVWPVFGVQLQADLGFLAFPRLCSDALIRRLAACFSFRVRVCLSAYCPFRAPLVVRSGAGRSRILWSRVAMVGAVRGFPSLPAPAGDALPFPGLWCSFASYFVPSIRLLQRGVHSIMPGTFSPLMLCSFRLASRLVRLRGRLHLSRSVALHLSFCA